MDFQNSLESALESIVSNAKTVLDHLKSEQAQLLDVAFGPADPLENAPQHVQLSRKKLLEAATNLRQTSTPPERYLEHLSNSYQEQTCMRWLVNLNVLPVLPPKGSISYEDLAVQAKVPFKQLRGVARMAVVNGFLVEPKPGHVAHSRLSGLLLRNDDFLNWAKWLLNYSIPTAYKLADATQKWGETDAKNETAFQLAMGTTDPFFDHLRKDATLTKVFSDYMRNVTASWPWSLQHAVDGFDWGSLPVGAKVVDVGGSHGQLAVKVAGKHPHLDFLIQDLPETIETAQKSFEADPNVSDAIKSRVQFMGHDFFKPQPVIDAHVYFLRMIIHDWPDRDALVILNQLRVALEKNPSARIVLMDTVLPPPGTISVLQEQQLRVRDLMMMQVFNARERELEDFKNLAERAGLEVTHVEQPLDSCMGLLTVQLASDSIPAHLEAPAIPTRQDSPLSASVDSINASEDPVLIMGAGIAGLCLAQALKKAGIPFTVFERDPSLDHRPQGYRLKLERDGAQALEDCLPDHIFSGFKSSCAVTAVGETDYNAISGQLVKSRQGGGLSGNLGLFPSFTVDRTAFRESLMSGIQDHIAFGKELVQYTTDTSKNIVTAQFKDGSSVQGRFIVGADGLHSAVRKQHIAKQGTLVDTGAVCIYGKTPLTPEVLERFPAKAMRWMTILSDTAPMLQSALIGDAPVSCLVETIHFTPESRAVHANLPADYLYWAMIGPKARFGATLPGDSSTKSSHEAAHQAARLTLDITAEWASSLRSLFELQETRQATCLRVASSVPDIPEWEPSSFVTLVGDAVHPMSPCGGVGANTGLCDAASLAKLLKVSAGRPREERVGAFELEMRARAKRSILRSEAGGKLMFGQRPLVDCQACEWLS